MYLGGLVYLLHAAEAFLQHLTTLKTRQPSVGCMAQQLNGA
jgi:hypothetical protein